MQVKDIINALNEWAPETHAENFDNVGLQIGDKEKEIERVLVTFEITEDVMNEAIQENAGMIITFHPLIFSGLKSITGKGRVEKMVLTAIQNNIAIYAIHTNLDAQKHGVNAEICRRLGLGESRILMPQKDSLYKLLFFVPHANAEHVKNALFEKGIGGIGDYSECSFSSEGTGTFKPLENANPAVGEKGSRHHEPETKVEVLVPQHLLHTVIHTLKSAHPYEEPAYDIIALENKNEDLGMGQIAEYEKAFSETDFLQHLKKSLPTECIRHSHLTGKEIKKVAVLGGSGAFAIDAAKAAGADALVTADLKYHDFFKAEGDILLCDIGHYESEQYNKFFITDYLSEKFSNFAVLTSRNNTNPINYFK